MQWTRRTNRIGGGLIVLLLGLAGGCGGPPDRAIADAERAMAAAELAARCAPEEYAAAQRMMDRARELVQRKQYREAEEAAKTAQELFDRARVRAEARREECLRPRPTDGLKPPKLDQVTGVDDGYELVRVHFNYDSSTIDEATKPILDRHAAWLKSHPSVNVQIAGHCDENGSTEYNLALGERRAETVRKYFVSLGIDATRLSTISYGKEMPLDPAANDAAYRKNRRAEFTKR